jgi:hypothetical protein
MPIITYPSGGFTWIEPVREHNHDRALDLLNCLVSEYNVTPDITRIIDRFWPLIDALCRMLPTIEGMGWQMDELKKSPELVRSLFLCDESTFLAMHNFEPKQRVTPKEEERLEDLPFPSGGNAKADQIAAFIGSTEWGPSEIKALFEFCSREELHSISYSLSELANPDRRIKERALAIVEEEFSEDDLDRAMNQAMVENW